MSVGLFIDLGLGAALLLAALVGILYGFCRQFSRALVSIISVISAIALVALVYPLIRQTGILNGFTGAAAGWFKPELYSTPITDAESLRATISNNYLRILSGTSDKMYERMVTMLGNYSIELTIGNFFGQIIVNVIFEFIMWLVFYLAIKYLLVGIKYLIEKITQVVVFKSIDKIIGIIWAAIWTYFIMIGVVLTTSEIVVAQFMPDYTTAFAGWIQNSTLLKFAHNTNVLGSFISNLLGTKLIDLSILPQ